jgi:hypothetical protein
MINGHEIRLNGIIERDNKSQQDSGIIRYISDGIESIIEFLPTNNSIFYYGDKVKSKEKFISKNFY